MIEFLKEAIGNRELLVFMLAMLPVSELRGAIPVGLAMGMPLGEVLALSIIGNLVPVLPLLFFLNPVSRYVRKLPVLNRFFEWFFERTERRAKLVRRYEALGLILFVGIPLPVTGAWTGSAAATLFKVRLRYAVVCIFLGVLLAAYVVTAACLLGKEAYLLLK